MLVAQLLLETLEELLQYEFKLFKFYLSNDVLDGCDRIRPAHLENATRVQTARKMIDSYGEESAVKVTVAILKDMDYNGVVEKLESRYAAGKSATPAASSSSSSSSSAAAPPAAPPAALPAAPPAAPAGMIAQHGAVIFAPNVNGGTTGSWNITINK